MKSIPPTSLRLSEAERDGLATDGFVVREAVFAPDEVGDMLDACERLVDDLLRDRRGHRLKAGSYVFDPDFDRDVIIKWEGDSDVVHGVEPCAHLSPELDRWAHDPRFEVPAGSVVMFGPYLVHHSSANTSGAPRRALLLSCQPPGSPHMLESLRRLGARYRSS